MWEKTQFCCSCSSQPHNQCVYLCIWFWELSKKKWDVAELRWNKRNKNCLALNHKSIKRVVTTSENISKLQCFAIRACSMVQHKRVGVDHTASLKGISSLKAIMCRMNLCTGVSILTPYGENPHYVKLPIFSEFMENSTKFMKNLDLTKWTQNQR